MLTIPAPITERQQAMQLEIESNSLMDSLSMNMSLAEIKSREHPTRPATVYFAYRGLRLASIWLRFEEPKAKIRDGMRLVPYASFSQGEQTRIGE